MEWESSFLNANVNVTGDERPTEPALLPPSAFAPLGNINKYCSDFFSLSFFSRGNRESEPGKGKEMKMGYDNIRTLSSFICW